MRDAGFGFFVRQALDFRMDIAEKNVSGQCLRLDVSLGFNIPLALYIWPKKAQTRHDHQCSLDR